MRIYGDSSESARNRVPMAVGFVPRDPICRTGAPRKTLTGLLESIEPDGCQTPRVLSEYELLSGIPVLFDINMNFNGCGFFSDLV